MKLLLEYRDPFGVDIGLIIRQRSPGKQISERPVPVPAKMDAR